MPEKDVIKANQEAMKIFVKYGADAAAKHILKTIGYDYSKLRSIYG